MGKLQEKGEGVWGRGPEGSGQQRPGSGELHRQCESGGTFQMAPALFLRCCHQLRLSPVRRTEHPLSPLSCTGSPPQAPPCPDPADPNSGAQSTQGMVLSFSHAAHGALAFLFLKGMF